MFWQDSGIVFYKCNLILCCLCFKANIEKCIFVDNSTIIGIYGIILRKIGHFSSGWLERYLLHCISVALKGNFCQMFTWVDLKFLISITKSVIVHTLTFFGFLLEKHIFLMIYVLSILYHLASHFGIPVSCAHRIVHKCVKLLHAYLVPKYIRWPTLQQWRNLAGRYPEWPRIVAILDCTPFRISRPRGII